MGQNKPLKPLASINDTDQSGLIIVLTAISFCFVLFSAGVRLSIRLVYQRSWRWDDTLSTIASAFFVAQAAFLFRQIHLGLGEQGIFEDTAQQHESVYKAQYASNVLYVITLCFSKLSVCSLFLRLTPQFGHRLTIWTILATCVAWSIASILLLCIGIPWTRALSLPFMRWLIVGITDGITEVLFVIMAVYLVNGLRIKMSRKCTVILAFAARLLVIPALSIRLYYLDASSIGPATATNLNFNLSIVCAQLQLSYGILAGSVTVLKPLLAVYEPSVTSAAASGHLEGYGNRYYRNDLSQYSYRVGPGGQIRQRRRSTSSDTPVITKPLSTIQQDEVELTSINKEDGSDVNVTKPEMRSNSTDMSMNGSISSDPDNDGRQMIIHMRKDWEVRYEQDARVDHSRLGERLAIGHVHR